MGNSRDARRGQLPPDMVTENGKLLFPKRAGRAGTAPGKKGRGKVSGKNPRARALFKTGPSKGISRTGKPRYGPEDDGDHFPI